MRKLIVTEFVSLDGVMEAPGDEATHPHTGWAIEFHGPELHAYKLDETLAAEALLLGRTTYDGFAAAWPERSGPFADKMNAMPKYVVSSTLENPEWNNTTVLSGDMAEEVSKLKSEDGGDILVAGSATLVAVLTDHGLVDELRLMVFPVLIGTGKRVFPDAPRDEKLEFTLADSTAFPSGVVVQTYHPA